MQHTIIPGDKFMLGSVLLNVLRFSKGIAYSHNPKIATILCDVSEDVPVLPDLNQYISCYILIDGHGSKELSSFIKSKFIMILFRELRRERRTNPTGTNVHSFIYFSMTKVYEVVERKLAKTHKVKLDKVSVCCVLIVGDIIYCCNVGSSCAMISRGGKVIQLCHSNTSKQSSIPEVH